MTFLFTFSFKQYAIHNTQYALRIITYEIISLFIQNEPKFRKSQVNVTDLLTKGYEKKDIWWSGKNEPNSKPIQTQTKPICHGVASGEAGSKPIFIPLALFIVYNCL